VNNSLAKEGEENKKNEIQRVSVQGGREKIRRTRHKKEGGVGGEIK